MKIIWKYWAVLKNSHRWRRPFQKRFANKKDWRSTIGDLRLAIGYFESSPITNRQSPIVNLSNWRIALVALLFFFTPKQIAYSCGPYLPSYHGYSFFESKGLFQNEDFPQLMGQFSDYLSASAKSNIQVKNNVTEWSEKFCEIPKRQDIGKLIYKSSLTDLERLRTAVLSENMPLPVNFADNTFATHLTSYKCTETIDYLIFAKRCEPFVTAHSGWVENEATPSRMFELIEEGKKAFSDAESPYIRIRYAYQIIRLAHYVKDYHLTLHLYKDLMPQVDVRVTSILRYWIEGHRAGALQSIGKRVDAAVIFARIFKDCPSKRMSAFRSFKIKNDEEWDRAMVLCESDSIRAAFHAVRAFNEQSKAVEELEAIYKFHPDNNLLKSLTVRELKKLESKFLGDRFKNKTENNSDYLQLSQKESEEYLERFGGFVEKVISDKKVKNTEFWELCGGYILLLKKDYESALVIFEKTEKSTKNEAVKKQLEKFKKQIQILQWHVVDQNVEEEIFELLEDEDLLSENKDLKRFLMDKMQVLYTNSQSPGMAFLCKNKLNDLFTNPPDEMINDLLKICEKSPKTDFERSLVQPAGFTIKYNLLDLKAMKLLAKGKTEAALEIYKKIPRTNWQDFGTFNPFEERIRECVNCSLKYETELFSKGEIMEKIIALDYKARAEIGANEEYLYQLGIIWFNMSYFGHSWNLLDRFRSGSNWYYRNKNHTYTTWAYPLGNKEFHDLSKAQIYFEQARQAATNPEIAAKATYMAARCEQNNWFVMPSPPPNRPREYFKILDDYKETDFYKLIIKECKYFGFYASKD